MKDAFDKMTRNLRWIVDEVGYELNLDLSIEELYSQRLSSGLEAARTLDRAVMHLLEAETDEFNYVLQAKEFSAATALVKGLLEAVKAEQSAQWARLLSDSEDFLSENGWGSGAQDELSVFGDEAADWTN